MQKFRKNSVLKKSWRILALSFGILILSFFGFFGRWQDFFQTLSKGAKSGSFRLEPLSPGFQNAGPNEVSVREGFANMPSPGKFSSFFYNPKDAKNKIVEFKTECADVYYAILIFSENDDYRQNPATARLNMAFPCLLGQPVSREVDVSTLNLSEGRYYYFVADQGKEGTWYNPR